MATNKIQYTEGTAIVWADTTDYSSTPSGLARTAQIDCSSLAAGAARQGAKVDLGATRARQYLVLACAEFASAAASFEAVDYFWAGSPHATAGNANPAGTTGADAAYTGTSGDALSDSLLQLQHVGALITTSDQTTPQHMVIGILDGAAIPRYGMPVVMNNGSGAFVATVDEVYFALIPIDDDVQAAA